MNNYGGKHSVLIVDDNPMSRILLRQLLEQISSIVIAGEYDNAVDAIAALNRSATDILFLDIEMPGMSGIELLQSLPVRPLTIFTSGNKTYGAEAFELNVVDYLVKPLQLPRTMMAINRAVELLKQKEVYLNAVESEHLFIKENKLIRKLPIDHIYILESKGIKFGQLLDFYSKTLLLIYSLNAPENYDPLCIILPDISETKSHRPLGLIYYSL